MTYTGPTQVGFLEMIKDPKRKKKKRSLDYTRLISAARSTEAAPSGYVWNGESLSLIISV